MTLISKNPLMYESVNAVGNRPLLVEGKSILVLIKLTAITGPNKPELTAIGVASQVESVRQQKYNTIFVGRSDGTVSKARKTFLSVITD